MGETEIILLPGLDGTGDLFAPLLGVMPPSFPRQIITYPVDQRLSYGELLAIVTARVPADRPVVLIAESFSGPLALWYAATHPAQVRAVVLCASFVCSPVPGWLRHLAHPCIFWLPIPSLGIRLLLVGRKTPRTLVQATKHAILRVDPAILAYRVRQVLAVDCADALAKCSAPVLYLRAEQDALVGDSSVRRILAAREDVIVRNVRGPHLLLQSSPAEAWGEIESFLRQELNLPHTTDEPQADAARPLPACDAHRRPL